MPGNHPHPPIALVGELDARPWAGVVVFSRGGTNVTIPANAIVFEDMLDFLDGRGSYNGRDLTEDAQAAWTAGGAAGTIAFGIDADDRLYIQASAQDFTIAAGAGNVAFGFSAAGHGLVGGAAPFRRTATAEWTRGNFIGAVGGPFLTIDPGVSFIVPSDYYRAQGLVTLLRKYDQGDADAANPTLALQYLDNVANDAVSGRIRWGMTDAGHVFSAWPTPVFSAPVWVSTTFRDRLGFSGSETVVAAGGLTTLTAAYPCPGVYVPTAPLEQCYPWVEETSETLELSSGRIASNHVATPGRWTINYFGDGPADQRDTSRHLLRCYKEHWHKGTRLALYQHWGDPRRALVGLDVNAGQAAYSILHTSEKDGYRGRLRCRRSPKDADNPGLRWPARLRRRLPVELQLTDAED